MCYFQASDYKSSLEGLEGLMNEFFATTNNDRKREIGDLLTLVFKT